MAPTSITWRKSSGCCERRELDITARRGERTQWSHEDVSLPWQRKPAARLRSRSVSWVQLCFRVGGAEAERLAACLEEAGAAAVSLQAASDENIVDTGDEAPPLWTATEVGALVEEGQGLEALLSALEARLSPLPSHRVTRVEPQDWSEGWKAHIRPLCFGGLLWVRQSWSPPQEPHAPSIVLDPGLAFGTGHHATTALCLEWLARGAGSFAGREVIDYGCGSGILALAAARLGARPVWAIDCDPRALAVTRANASSNGLEGYLTAASPEELPRTRQAAVLFANILLHPLMALASRFAGLVARDGRIVLSGLLENQVEPCLAAYEPWFMMERIECLEGWALAEAVARDRRSGTGSTLQTRGSFGAV